MFQATVVDGDTNTYANGGWSSGVVATVTRTAAASLPLGGTIDLSMFGYTVTGNGNYSVSDTVHQDILRDVNIN